MPTNLRTNIPPWLFLPYIPLRHWRLRGCLLWGVGAKTSGHFSSARACSDIIFPFNMKEVQVVLQKLQFQCSFHFPLSNSYQEWYMNQDRDLHNSQRERERDSNSVPAVQSFLFMKEDPEQRVMDERWSYVGRGDGNAGMQRWSEQSTIHTCLGHLPYHFWRWFSFPPGGIC